MGYNINMLNNLKLIGYKAIQHADGEVLAQSPNGERVIFNKSMEVISNGFNYVYKLEEGVHVIFKDKYTSIFNKNYGNIDIDLKYSDIDEIRIKYVGNHYIFENCVNESVTIYNIKGKLIAKLETTELISIVMNDNSNKLAIFVRNIEVTEHSKLIVIDIATGNCLTHSIEPELFTTRDVDSYYSRYIGDNKIVVSGTESMYIYDVDTKSIKEFEGFSCEDYLESVNSLLSTSFYSYYAYIIVNNSNTNRYYLMDEKETMKLIDTDLVPIIYNNEYYIARTNTKQFILDNKFNVISKGYNRVSFIGNNRAVAINDGNVTILNIKTMEEKNVFNNASYYNFDTSLAEIIIATDKPEGFVFNLSGEFLYTTAECNEILGFE